jgi:hypothetical protein
MQSHEYIPKECYGIWEKIVDEWRTLDRTKEFLETVSGTARGTDSRNDEDEDEDQSPLSHQNKANPVTTPTAPLSEEIVQPNQGAQGIEVYGSRKEPDNVGLALCKQWTFSRLPSMNLNLKKTLTRKELVYT